MNKLKTCYTTIDMDQDWKPVILHGTCSKKVQPKSSSFVSHQHAKERKLEQNEKVSEKETNRDIRTLIQKKRIELGLTQKQLATKLNEQEHVVKDIENGKLLSPSPQLISKLKRILNVSFKLS